jgi:nucleoside-diphosphate-sugar epimerase
MSSLNILVTGATGFIGGSLIKRLTCCNGESYKTTAVVRQRCNTLPIEVPQLELGDFLPTTNWHHTLQDIDVVIHCAAHLKELNHDFASCLDTFRTVNVRVTLNLAMQAALNKVKRFIFVSSIKVNGEFTKPGQTFKSDDKPHPRSLYGLTKYEAEQGLRLIEKLTGMEVVVIRPPLVYGVGVKSNFESMISFVARGFPLPFGMIKNARSLVSVDNLVDLIFTCIDHHAAKGQTFTVCDGEDISTPELLCKVAQLLNVNIFLFPVPRLLIELCACAAGKSAFATSLCRSLQLDQEKTCRLLGWSPPFTLNQSLRHTVEEFER